jgi:hypothetical protein
MDTYPVEHRRPLGSEPRPECIPRLFQPKVIVKVAPTRPRYIGVAYSESDQGGPFRLYGGCSPVAKLGQLSFAKTCVRADPWTHAHYEPMGEVIVRA